MKRLFSVALASAMLLQWAPVAGAQSTAVDSDLAAEIAGIKAYDNHAHPLKVVGPSEHDTEYDALPPEGLEPFPLPVRLRPDNPQFIEAWRALYGYPYTDATDAHVGELLAMKQKAMQEHGDGYPAWVLDRLNIETMTANRIAMGRGLSAPRFRWVSFLDALLFPLSNAREKAENPDRRVFFGGEEALLKRYLAEAGLRALPATLDEYLARLVTPTLERHKREGAIAVKFEAAYLRRLDFANPPESEARRVYAGYAKGGEPGADEYKALQDYVFRYIAREAGRLGLAVHLHTGAGIGSYFDLTGSNPMLLEPIFNDPSLRKTNFVLLHGGFPFERADAALFMKPNVYADFSAMTFILTPYELARVLRGWLEFMPEKVFFATDAFEIAPMVSWEEVGWLSNTTGRQALAIALTGMVRDGEITRERALELAHMVLHDSAVALYGPK